MKNFTEILLLATLVCLAFSDDQFFSDSRQLIAPKKGVTFQATIWPEQRNSYVGRMSCNHCNPQDGDTACTISIPILCIISPKTFDRPFYDFYPDFTPNDNPDRSFYEGWTGGVFGVTDPIRGVEITGYIAGDNLCKSSFGIEAKFAEFTDGYYMKYMNSPDLKIQKAWNWGQAATGEFNLWGYFNHNYYGRAWVWNQRTPTGNCVLPKTNPIP